MDPTRLDEEPMLALAGRRALGRLAEKSPDPMLREMAREILAGRLTPRDVMASNVYTEALTGGAANEFAAWYVSASERERAEAATLGHAKLAELAEQPEESPSTPARPAPVNWADDEESFEYHTYLR